MHAFCGVKASFINDRWELEEHLLDLHPLEGDHSGESTAKLIFKALRRRGLLKKLCTSFSAVISVSGLYMDLGSGKYSR
jgi:hypothetical protein